MARKAPITNIPIFPPPTAHKICAGDVFERDATRLIVTEVPKGAPQIECRDITTGKLKIMLKHILEEKFAKLGTTEAAKCARALVRLLKSQSKAAAPNSSASKTRKPRTKKADANNVPASGPNPSLN